MYNKEITITKYMNKEVIFNMRSLKKISIKARENKEKSKHD